MAAITAMNSGQGAVPAPRQFAEDMASHDAPVTRAPAEPRGKGGAIPPPTRDAALPGQAAAVTKMDAPINANKVDHQYGAPAMSGGASGGSPLVDVQSRDVTPGPGAVGPAAPDADDIQSRDVAPGSVGTGAGAQGPAMPEAGRSPAKDEGTEDGASKDTAPGRDAARGDSAMKDAPPKVGAPGKDTAGADAPKDAASDDVAGSQETASETAPSAAAGPGEAAPGEGVDTPASGPFLNGAKPKIAIVDNGFAEPEETFGTLDPDSPRSLAGHGAVVKDVLEQQLGVDGKRVDIDEYEVGESTDPTAFVETLEAVAASDTTYDYANLSVGLWNEGVHNIGTGAILTDFNAAAEAGGREGVAGGGAIDSKTVAAGLDLTDAQKRSVVDFAIDQYTKPLADGAGALDRFKNDFGRAFAAGVALMEKGTSIAHAGPGQDGSFDPLSLLDGFNESTPGRFSTVQATNENVLENSFEFEDDPTAADREIVPVTGNVEADASVGGRAYGQDFGINADFEASSFAAPESIAEEIKARLGGIEPLSNAERAEGIGPQSAESVFYTRPADPAAPSTPANA